MGIQINHKSFPNGGSENGAPSLESERKHLDALLLPHAGELLELWCGEIEVSGVEIIMRNPLRADENLGSFRFNRSSGAWSDFAVENFKGYGLTYLYAAIKDLTLVNAVAALKVVASTLTAAPMEVPKPAMPAPEKPSAVNPDTVIKPPDLHPELGAPTKVWEYREIDGRLSFYVYRFEKEGKKETRPVAWAAQKNAWVWQYPEPLYPIYNLAALAKCPGALVVVTEGEKAADAAALQFPDAVVVTSACGSDQALRTDWSPLKGRSVVIAPDKDAPGRHYALAVAGAALAQVSTAVRVVDVWQLQDWAPGDDLADHEVTPAFLTGAVDALSLFQPTELEPHVVKAATLLGRGDLDRGKKKLADQLGIGIRTFEGMVKEVRTKEDGANRPEVAAYPFDDDALEPWDSPVEGDILFAEIVALIHRHVIVTPSQAAVVACWIIFSYGFEVMRICPQLLINSPSKRCGKSTLLELILSLVRRPLPAANISSAAVFRSIEAWKPTLLIDEADTFLNSKSNDDITGILNSGHNQSLAYVIRTQEVDGDHVPMKFSTFCPKVIAMIKAPADTIIDRSIVVTLARKLESQSVDALAIDAADQMKDARRRIRRWIADALDSVKFDLEAVPRMGNDRARQNWAVLAAFAFALGPKACSALQSATSDLSDTSAIEEDLETDLLADIRELVHLEKKAYIQSAVIVQELVKRHERPWVEINRGKPLTENKLARLLKPFGLAPAKFRDGMVTHRGYPVAGMQAVFDRYLPVNVGEAP